MYRKNFQPFLDYFAKVTGKKVICSGKHDHSVPGVASGDCDAAGIASDVFERMMHGGTLKCEDFRIIFRSPFFLTSSYANAHDLNPTLVAKITEAFFSFKYPPEASKAFEGTTNVVPIDYKKGWHAGRDVVAAGETSTREGPSKITLPRVL